MNYPPKSIYRPFEVGEKVRPHFNFKKYYGHEQVTVASCERGNCETGWLVKVEEFTNPTFGNQEFDSSWFFKLKKDEIIVNRPAVPRDVHVIGATKVRIVVRKV
jgi:hypothetical protein